MYAPFAYFPSLSPKQKILEPLKISMVILRGFPLADKERGRGGKNDCAAADMSVPCRVRAEPGFTKVRFQDMAQYPEKSDQWDAR